MARSKYQIEVSAFFAREQTLGNKNRARAELGKRWGTVLQVGDGVPHVSMAFPRFRRVMIDSTIGLKQWCLLERRQCRSRTFWGL